jgi:hypothetical protein
MTSKYQGIIEMPAKDYLSRPFPVTAIQYIDNLKEVMDFVKCDRVQHDYEAKTITLIRHEVGMLLRVGDYVAKIPDGQILGYRQETFEILYEEDRNKSDLRTI